MSSAMVLGQTGTVEPGGLDDLSNTSHGGDRLDRADAGR
jgi:hypothetical protein